MEGLNLKYLDIRNTCAVELEDLRKTNIEVLDLRGQKMRYIGTLLKMPNVKKIIVDDESKYSYNEARSIRKLKAQGRVLENVELNF